MHGYEWINQKAWMKHVHEDFKLSFQELLTIIKSLKWEFAFPLFEYINSLLRIANSSNLRFSFSCAKTSKTRVDSWILYARPINICFSLGNCPKPIAYLDKLRTYEWLNCVLESSSCQVRIPVTKKRDKIFLDYHPFETSIAVGDD